jgi:thioesterase domain-containing protein
VDAAGAELRRQRLLERRAQLSAEQRRRLETRMRGDTAAPPPRPPGGSLLVEITPRSGRGRLPEPPPLFCVHGVGGDAFCFFPLARRLGAAQPCYGLQALGLAPGELPLERLEDMAACYVAELRRVQEHGPYLLAGWSFGGLAAFEMALQLRAAGEAVALVAILDGDAGLRAGAPASLLAAGDDLAPLLLDMARYAAGIWGKDLGLQAAEMAGRDPELQLLLFVARARAAGLVHQAGSLEQVRRLVAVFRANVAAYRAYRPRPYDGNLVLVCAATSVTGEPDLGWERLAAAVSRLQAPGNHVTLLAEPHVATLAGLLQSAIALALPH